MKYLIALALLALSGVAGAQSLVNCAPATPCSSTTGPANTGTGDAAWKAFGKINENLNGGTISANTSGNAATASALAVIPSLCTAGKVPTGVDASGNPVGCFTPGGSGNVTNDGSPAAGNLGVWTGLTSIGGVTVGSNTFVGNVGAGIVALSAPQAIGLLDNIACNTQTASYLAILTDANGCITENSSSATAVTIQPSGTVAMPAAATLTIEQLGTGAVSITLGGGVTSSGPGPWVATASLGGPSGSVQLEQVSTDVWAVVSYAPGNSKFTVAGTCNTPSATAGGATGGTITLAASGTVNSCTLIVTPGGGMTAQHLLVGQMCDRTQLAVPCWPASASSATTITFTIPAATAASDVLSFLLTAE